MVNLCTNACDTETYIIQASWNYWMWPCTLFFYRKPILYVARLFQFVRQLLFLVINYFYCVRNIFVCSNELKHELKLELRNFISLVNSNWWSRSSLSKCSRKLKKNNIVEINLKTMLWFVDLKMPVFQKPYLFFFSI